jgi:hypothetical protein
VNNLSKELSHHIANCLGISPITFGKIGLTVDDLKTNYTFKFNSENNEVKTAIVYSGYEEQSMINFMSTSIDNGVESFLVLAFKNKETNKIDLSLPVIGFYFNNEEGEFYNLHESKWVSLSLVQKLKFALSVETMIQEGVIFSSNSNDKDLYSCFSNFISSI